MLVNALQDYERYINIDKGNKVAWLNKGYLLYQMGRTMEAIDAFQNAAIIDPKDATIQAALADTYLKPDKYEEAVKFYVKAIQFDPKTSRNYGNLAWAYYLLNDDWKCIEYSLKATKLDPHAYFARYNMALAYLRSGFYEEALKHYRELAKEQGIPSDQRAGAISDLRTMQSKGIRVAETAAILKDCFGL
jgi:tetratricopeptide (TPR) repeat protein